MYIDRAIEIIQDAVNQLNVAGHKYTMRSHGEMGRCEVYFHFNGWVGAEDAEHLFKQMGIWKRNISNPNGIAVEIKL